LGLGIYTTLWEVADWLFPPLCSGCGKSGFRFCPDFEATIIKRRSAHSHRRSIIVNNAGFHRSSQGTLEGIHNIGSFAEFSGPLRKAIHHLKYQPDAALADYFSGLLAVFLQEDLKWDFELVSSIPLSQARQKSRGFNQVNLIAIPLALRLERRFASRLIKRIRETESQVGKTAQERQINVRGAFQADPCIAQKKSILILDDVVTTGSTMKACMEALQEAGASRVYGLSLAKTPIKQQVHEKINELIV
jgi:ComF family protein